jgi:phage anti-repressor protein
MLRINENNRVLGREIHTKIESKTAQYSIWINRAIQDADLEEGKDFYTILYKSTGGRPKKEYEFTIDAAKEICLLERNEKGKEIRRWLIELSKQHETGLAFTSEQILSLIDLSKCMCLVSIQKEVERKHFDLYAQPQSWWNYRAALLGYSKDSLIEAMKAVNKKHNSIRESLLKLDANELIRTGVIDFMLAVGKSQEYAKNVGGICYDMASKMELGKLIWDDTKPDSLGINKPFCNTIKQTYKQLK